MYMAIKFKLNERKAVEAVLWFIEHGVSNKYWIFKMLFSAEKYHLNKYGRPITGETYIAMEFGTVPKWLFKYACKKMGLGFALAGNSLIAERKYIRKFFSKTDIEALEYGCNEYKNLKTFNEVKDKNHKEPAWEKAWKKHGARKEVPMRFEDFIHEDWLKEELKWKSHFIAI
jgi:uncharacterized phage-associated protein